MYLEHEREVPAEASKAGYRDDIARAYPFHPALIDTLYRRWGSHPDFQRTRGVLRLLASIVGDLWDRRDTSGQSQPLIQPCHLRWSLDPLAAGLTRLWGQGYQSVAAADVIGDRSNAGIFDDERGGEYEREAIGRGIAAAILLGSFGGQGERSGYSAKDVKLACSRPDLNWSYTDGALLELENRCFYLHAAPAGSLGKRYWFGTQPTLNKLVVQYRQRVAGEDFEQEIVESLNERMRGQRRAEATWRVLVDPQADLPEQRSLTLLVLPPALAFGDDEASQRAVQARVLDISQRCGGKERHYRNTLLFLAASGRGAARLRRAYREREALRGVQRDYGEQLPPDQMLDLRKRIDEADRAVSEALGPAYVVALRVHRQLVESFVLSDARPGLDEHLEQLWALLVEERWILRRVGGVTLQKAGLVPTDGAIPVREAVEAFLRFTDKPLVASQEAVVSGLTLACLEGLIGIARGPDGGSLQAGYCRRSVSIDPSEEGVWIIPPFPDEPLTGPLPAPPPSIATQMPLPTGQGIPVGEAVQRPVAGAEPRRVRTIRIEGAVPLESYNELFRCFVSPAARMSLKRLELGVRFVLEAQDSSPLDPSDATLRAMKEAARQLGLRFTEDGSDETGS